MTTTISGTYGVSQVQDGTITTAKIVDGTILPHDLSGNQTGSAPIFGCRAWCVFNGTLTGTNPPTAGGNVTSVTRNSAGNYTVNFTTAMSTANYAFSVIGSNAGQTETIAWVAQTTSSATFVNSRSGVGPIDAVTSTSFILIG